jgi:hypothetical protein
MSGKRKAPRPVGLGYMPKGGRPAALAQNERWKAAQAVQLEEERSDGGCSAAPPAAGSAPVTADVREDVRASARPTVRRTERVGLVAAGAVVGSVVPYLVAWVWL